MSSSQDAASQLSFLQDLNFGVAVASLIGSSWMTIFCLRTERPRPVSLQIILAIALSDFIYSIANVMSYFESHFDNSYCITEGFFRQFSYMSTIFWTSCTALLCYKTSLSERKFNQQLFLKRCFKSFIVIIVFLNIT